MEKKKGKRYSRNLLIDIGLYYVKVRDLEQVFLRGLGTDSDFDDYASYRRKLDDAYKELKK